MPKTQIHMFMHCVRCMEEKPPGTSPRDWSQLECGWTKKGFQVWCKRHECSVVHVDFEGVKHPADVTTAGDFGGGNQETIQ